jgi:hypothetical protein
VNSSFPSVALAGCVLVFLTAGCQKWQERGAKGVGLLPAAGDNQRNFADFQPSNPYVRTADGLLVRKVFETSGPAGLHVEVDDLLIGPGQRPQSVKLVGALVCDVRSGTGIRVLDDQRQEFRAGSTFAIPDGKTFTIENTGNEAIQIHLHVIRTE